MRCKAEAQLEDTRAELDAKGQQNKCEVAELKSEITELADKLKWFRKNQQLLTEQEAHLQTLTRQLKEAKDKVNQLEREVQRQA